VHPLQKNIDVSVQRMEALAKKDRAAIREKARNRPALIEQPESDQQDFIP